MTELFPLPVASDLKEFWPRNEEGVHPGALATTGAARRETIEFLLYVLKECNALPEAGACADDQEITVSEQEDESVEEELDAMQVEDNNDTDSDFVEESQEAPSEPDAEEEEEEEEPRPRKKRGENRKVEVVVVEDEEEEVVKVEEKKEAKLAPIFDATPTSKNVTLFPHQEESLKWLLERNATKTGVFLADMMGIGKTVQSLALIHACWEASERKERGNLILVPSGMETQWLDEVHKRFPVLFQHTHIYKKSKKLFSDALLERSLIVIAAQSLLATEAQKMIDPDTKRKSYVIGTDPEKTRLIRHKWTRIIVDESHGIRNPKTRLYKAAVALEAETRICLTGTPINNNYADLSAQCTFLRTDPRYCDPKWHINPSPADREEFQRKHILRRTRKQVDPNMIERKVEIVLVEPTKEEYDLYDKIATTADMDVKKSEQQDTKAQTNLKRTTWVLRLRQVVNDARLLKASCSVKELDEKQRKLGGKRKRALVAAPDAPVQPPPPAVPSKEENEFAGLDVPTTVGSKTRKIIDMSAEMLEKYPDKQIVISQWTEYLDMLEAEYVLKNIPTLRYDGKTGNYEKRAAVLKEFRKSTTHRVLLLSFHAGCQGHNIECANRILMCDQWFHQPKEDQAIGRVDRFGQTKQVYVYMFQMNLSVEKALMTLKRSKAHIADVCCTSAWKQPDASMGDKKQTFIDCIRMHSAEKQARLAALQPPVALPALRSPPVDDAVMALQSLRAVAAPPGMKLARQSPPMPPDLVAQALADHLNLLPLPSTTLPPASIPSLPPPEPTPAPPPPPPAQIKQSAVASRPKPLPVRVRVPRNV